MTASWQPRPVVTFPPTQNLSAHRHKRAADVRRCHALRASLELFDFDHPSIAFMQRLLLRAAFSPAFLRGAEGRRFISFLFTINAGLVRELNPVFRNLISFGARPRSGRAFPPSAPSRFAFVRCRRAPKRYLAQLLHAESTDNFFFASAPSPHHAAGRAGELASVGDVLYRAWRTAEGEALQELEGTVLQGLMEGALGAATPRMAASLRKVLAAFHDQKAQPGVDAFLLRLWRPILFRALNAANPAVRRNAVGVLTDAFPLCDPEAPAEETDELRTQQARGALAHIQPAPQQLS